MKYYPFVYTRSLTEDYNMHVMPDNFPTDFYRRMQELIFLRERLRNEDIDWNKIVFFTSEGENIAYRVVDNGLDYVGRQIYSIEGLIPDDKGIRAYLAMVDLWRYFDSLERTFAEMESKDELPDMVYVEDLINPLIPFELNKEIPIHIRNNVIKSFVMDISKRNERYSCVIGPKAGLVRREMKEVYQRAYDYYIHEYDLTDAVDITGFESDDRCREIEINDHLNNTDEAMDLNEKVTLYIRFYKEGKTNGKYEWILKRNSDGLCIKSQKRKIIDGISFEKLAKEEAMIKTYYSLLGFSVC
ncbi:MAG: hypothetical protein IKQ44_00765 [Lachnospiraceae bacterium]|nr:hypothetical protein [Lachnospiraceae bacterium]